MEYLDMESFRSKYSDITVTAVPTRSEEQSMSTDVEMAAKHQEPRVEITRVSGASGISYTANLAMLQRNRQQQNAAAIAYATEYKEVMAKLEYTKYMQAQLQLMSLANGGGNLGAAGLDCGPYGMMQPSINLDANANIVDKYSDLLNILTEMRSNLSPTVMGLRAPKERLQRDIAQARVRVRECLMLLEKDRYQETEENQSEGIPPSE
ncbi:uncharacterized protein LOC128263369 [Drosophila gunungcola]|uniref:Uncharacterized protein n=1 Tax=Drosophila gunungcola TaxID=103775 RepID=A0A9P9YU78_9MUSC|nr:uncharacterized protein LOC128263369 [Drosophila gunungcola]KAI8043225.1 hypothetical protein M5D96_004552 [Drosophila gunungcola]